MLSPRSKIIILILGAVLVVALIVITVFDWWPKGEEEAAVPAPVDLSFLEEKETMPTGQVFDASNKEAFSALTGESEPESNVSPLEREARDLAEFFVARFGTYSSDANWAHLDDLQSFMTASMQDWTKRFKVTSPKRDGYFVTAAEVAATERLLFSAPDRRARFSVLTNRTETNGGQTETYQQPATIELKQDSAGDWKVNGLFWGDKLK